MQRCPSGLRGWFQAPLSSDSWVRIPLFVYVRVAQWIRRVTSNHKIAGSSPVMDYQGLIV